MRKTEGHAFAPNFASEISQQFIDDLRKTSVSFRHVEKFPAIMF